MDSCYSFWVGGTLQILGRLAASESIKLLGYEGFINKEELGNFLLFCQAPPVIINLL